MGFFIDNQTYNDLSILTKLNDEKSLLDFFCQTKTSGGRGKLEELFKLPLSDINVIRGRRDTIKYFSQNETGLVFNKRYIDFIEYYFNIKVNPEKYSFFKTCRKYFKNFFYPDNNYYLIKRGVQYLIDQLTDLYRFSENIQLSDAPDSLKEFCESIITLISTSDLISVIKYKSSRNFNIFEIDKLDFQFRFSFSHLIKNIFGKIYELDVYMSVAEFAKAHSLAFPLFIINNKGIIEIKGCYHPFINNPVKNDVFVNPNNSIFFLTGANMTGKSTLLKAVGINTFLSHLGFPVFADHMEISIFKGILTTINLPDSISKGYSHFYSEVLRIKEVCLLIRKHNSLVVIIDELFKSTNSPDSTETAFSVISELSRLNGSPIFISTHNIDLATKLSQNNSIQFKCFRTISDGALMQSCFSLKEGISNEHNGDFILRNENVLSIIEEIIKNQEQNELPEMERILI